jgi:Holliday junction resolvase RusA-like endonuclease
MIKVLQYKIQLNISGKSPRPYSTGGEKPWRKYILDFIEQRKKEGEIPEAHLQATTDDRFEVSLLFHIMPSNNPPDLDNLSKSVLDTLFLSPTGNNPYKGALYQVDDHQVWKLHLEKRLVETEPEAGVSISITTLPQ